MKLTKNLVAEAAITAYSIVKFGSTDDYAVLAAAASDALMGVSGGFAAATGDRIDVQMAGEAEVKLGGTVARGGPITADASGFGVAGASTNRIIGFALMSGVSGDVIRVLLAPHTI